MKRLIECVPNFSEGRDLTVIKQITDAIESVEGVKLLDVDPGKATNRTVVTFVGEPEAVVEAAFRGVAKASELIDMRYQHGEHPRIGATDVLPLVPISGITLAECAELARELAQRITNELAIPTYCYEAAALKPERKNLAVCRKGEYEALQQRITQPDEMPDFGGGEWTEQAALSGATVVGARDFLIAVNFNLNTTSTRRANAIAFDVREKGRPMREKPIVGKIIRNEQGEPIMIPGTLKGCKAIGWYIAEYGIAQVSMNITDIAQTPLHVAFEEVCRAAAARGVRVTGTEIVGLVPRSALLEAGKYFLRKQQRSLGITDQEIIDIAVRTMGLAELCPFKPEEKIVESLIEKGEPVAPKLIDLSCKGFAEETSRESPAPGGGSISAYMGALGAALGTMVANLSAHKPGWDDRWEFFSDWAEKGKAVMNELLHLVDEDTDAFNGIMAVFAMPKGTPEEKAARAEAMESATLYATQVPLKTMKASLRAFEIAGAMAEEGNPNSVSDAGVGALAARAAVQGAFLNVKINAAGLKDRLVAEELVAEAAAIARAADAEEKRILEIVESKID
ncbi:MAG: glutamate formimidoyltransferase [Tidjanibacter sp.]|nr:glutamate formimidoyltransferase [Tidjanibacter sp.]